MARPRSDDKRSAILAAATRVIASQGLGAPTATIAKEAGVSNGSLFTYFETKAELLNQLYLELKTEMAAASMDGLPTDAELRDQALHMWTNSLRWASADPDKRKVIARLGQSNDITSESLETGHRIMAGVARQIERGRENGPLRDAPLEFVVGVMNAIGETTNDFMIRDPANAEQHRLTGFEAFWRAIA